MVMPILSSLLGGLFSRSTNILGAANTAELDIASAEAQQSGVQLADATLQMQKENFEVSTKTMAQVGEAQKYATIAAGISAGRKLTTLQQKSLFDASVYAARTWTSALDKVN